MKRMAAKRLMKDEAGLAFLEFALILPVLLLLLLGGIELSRYIQTAQKVDKLTHTIVDLVAQAPTISTNDLDQIMAAAEHIMEPLDFSRTGVMMVTCVGYDSNGNLIVKWQYKGGGDLVRSSKIGAVNATPVLPAGFTVDSRDNVLIAETYYTFTPMVNESIVDPIEFYRTAYYLPRMGELGTLIVN